MSLVSLRSRLSPRVHLTRVFHRLETCYELPFHDELEIKRHQSGYTKYQLIGAQLIVDSKEIRDVCLVNIAGF